MPLHEDDTPRLAEIARSINDFRQEFRSAVDSMVRRDVYGADMRTLEVKMSALQADNTRLNREIETDRTSRQSTRNLMLGAFLTATVSIIMTIIQAVI